MSQKYFPIISPLFFSALLCSENIILFFQCVFSNFFACVVRCLKPGVVMYFSWIHVTRCLFASCFCLCCVLQTGQEKAGGVTLEVVKELPQLQEKEARVGRFSNGGHGGGGGRFSGGRGGGFSDRRSGGFSRGSGGGRGRSNNKW